MDEQGEIPQKEQVVIPPELQAQMEQSMQNIESGMGEPAVEIANGTQQMGMFSELWKLWKDANVKRLGIMFKDAKVALGILPFVDRVSKWNTARIASKPIEGLSDEAIARVDAAKTELAATKTTTVYAVEKASQEQVPMLKAQSSMEEAGSELAKARRNLQHAQKKYKGVPDGIHTDSKVMKAAERFAKAEKDFQEKTSVYGDVRKGYLSTHQEAMDKLSRVSEPVPPKNFGEKVSRKTSEAAKKYFNIHTDEAFRVKAEQVRKQYAKSGKILSEEQLLHIVANGEAPALTGWEKTKRGGKIMGLNFILTNLGPIINPIPDVPPLVADVSHAMEAFGGKWYAGLVPPVWQYLHNRYEDMSLGFNSSRQAMEIINRHWNQRIDRLEEKKIEKAAGVFLPKRELPLAA